MPKKKKRKKGKVMKLKGLESASNVRERLPGWVTCDKCDLCRYRRNVVLGEGPVPAEIMLIGEAPGKAEDLRGIPFVGPAGRVLRKAIEAAIRMVDRVDDPPTIFITNVVACRPTDRKNGPNREPSKEEAHACQERIVLTERMVSPREIVFLGGIARQHLRSRFPSAKHLVHPSYILRRGGVESTEYRTFVRGLSEVFAPQERGTLFEE